MEAVRGCFEEEGREAERRVGAARVCIEKGGREVRGVSG